MGSNRDYIVVSIMTILLCLLFLTLTFCDKAHATEYCFTEIQSQNLCVFMEKCDSYKEQVQMCLSANSELEQENNLLKQNFKLSTDNLQIEQEINKTLKERIVLMDKQCDKRVEDAKPSFWYKVGLFTEGMIAGGVIALIGLLAL